MIIIIEKLFPIFLCIIFFNENVTGQSYSFQIRLDTSGYRLNNVAANENNDVVIIFDKQPPYGPNEGKEYFLLKINGQPGNHQGFKLQLPVGGGSFTTKSHYFDARAFLAQTFTPSNTGTNDPILAAITSIDLINGSYWCKKIRNGNMQSARFIADKAGNIYVVNIPELNGLQSNPYPNKNVIELYKLDSLGNQIWKKGFVLNGYIQNEKARAAFPEIEKDHQGNLYLTGHYSANPAFLEGQFIMKLDSLGNQLGWKSIPNHFFDKMTVTEDGIYLLDKGYLDYHWNLDYFNDSSAVLVKFDHNLNFKWAKKFSADHFRYTTAEIRQNLSGDLLMMHSTKGAYPVILSEIDGEGNILSQKGYPNHSPTIKVLTDGSYLLGSRYFFDSTGQTIQQIVIAKTDTEGLIEGCDTFPTCLRVENASIQLDSFTVDTFPILGLEDVLLEVEPVSFSISDFCGYPPPPLPDFNFPSPLCLNDTASTTHTYNRLANAREWRLTGPGVDSVLADSFNFSYRFTMPGEYLLRQTVWVLGCSSSFEKTITVLPPLEAAIAPAHLCPDEPQVLHVETNRPVNSYLWSTGGSTASLPVHASGTYTVQVSDGVCQAADTLQVEVVAEWIGSQTPLQLPPDTTVCHTDLPFRLVPQSPFTDSFFLAGDLAPADTFYLPSPGDYRIGMTAFGCYFYENFNLEVDCRADVYLPNVFSPNGDGINDEFYPMGTDFEVLELSVFDRWGGLRYRGSGPAARWTGERATQGTYVYQLVFKDLLSGKREVLTGEVTLVR